MKLKIHPLFFVAAALYLALGQARLVIACFCAVILHELAHSIAAKRHGVRLEEITLMPYGAVVHGGNTALLGKKGISVVLAGPLFNLFVFVMLSGLWWHFPETYGFTRELALINLYIGLFNLLPLMPLDGSKLVLILVKRKLRAAKIMRIFGIIFAILLVVTTIVLVVVNHAINLSLITVAIFILYGAILAKEDDALSYAAADVFAKIT